LFGPWGLLLGVPVARYVIHDVLGIPFRRRAAAARPDAAAG
jgi:predicted PurR-regulated permease PerM